MSPDRIEGFRRAFEHTIDPRVVAVLLAFLGLVCILGAFALHVVRRYNVQRRRRSFHAGLQKLELSAPLENMLTELSGYARSKDPCAVLNEKYEFERALHDYLLIPARREGHRHDAALAEQVATLRNKLETVAFRDHDIVCSTRNIPEGANVLLALPAETEDGQNDAADGVLTLNSLEYFEISITKDIGPILPDTSVAVYFYDAQGANRFETKLLSVRSAVKQRWTCRLNHALNPTDINKRKSRRVGVLGPVKVVLIGVNGNQQYDMELRDLSLGGAALKTAGDIDMANGNRMVIGIQPERLFFSPHGKGRPFRMPAKRLSARVTRKQKTEDGRFLYGCEFTDTAPSDRMYLQKLIQSLD